uniref:Protein kinase domain-containing protein n=1 Tax=Stegastes partitus TaxID=144197 RepID=A0A3B5AJZ8_9TELE
RQRRKRPVSDPLPLRHDKPSNVSLLLESQLAVTNSHKQKNNPIGSKVTSTICCSLNMKQNHSRIIILCVTLALLLLEVLLPMNNELQIITGTRLGRCHIVEDVLGRGSFGTVAKCQNMHTNSTEAVKVNGSAPMFMDLAFKEISFLKRLRCLDADTCNIVKWNGYFFHKQSICMTFEVLDQSLKAYLEERGSPGLPAAEIRPVLHQLVTALAHIHSIGVLHLDLKPDNVMVVDCTQQPVRVKIIDFGLAGLLSEVKVGERRGTPSYMAPEMMLAAPFDETFDMWSLGVIAAELAMGWMRTPMFFCRQKNKRPLWRLKSREEFHPGHHSDQQSLLSLIKSMLHLDAGQRVKAREALQHPFFAPGVQHKEDEQTVDLIDEVRGDQAQTVDPIDEPIGVQHPAPSVSTTLREKDRRSINVKRSFKTQKP